MKLNINSNNKGMNYLLNCYGMNLYYGDKEAIEYLIFIDNLNVDMDEIILY